MNKPLCKIDNKKYWIDNDKIYNVDLVNGTNKLISEISDKDFYYPIHREEITEKHWDAVSKYIVESCGYKGKKHHKDVNYYDIMEDRQKQEIKENKKIWKELLKTSKKL